MKVVIIGSGIVGASAAFHLARSGKEVLLIDDNRRGKATFAGAGIVFPWDKKWSKEWFRVAEAGALYYPTLISELQDRGERNVGYKKVGALLVGHNPVELERRKKTLESMREETPEIGEISRLTNKEARELFPPLHEELEAIYVSGAARVDGWLLRNALKRTAEAIGVECLDGTASLLQESGEIKGVVINGKKIYADRIIVATGAWASEILQPLGVEIHVEPQRGQIIHINLPNEHTSDWPIILPDSSHYLLAFDDRVVAGATRETGSGFDYRLTAGGIHEVLTEALDIAPGLSEGTLEEIRIGFRPMGPNQLPQLGRLEPYKNVILATGVGASGLTMGPYVGKLAACITMNEKIELPIEDYHPMREIKVGKKG